MAVALVQQPPERSSMRLINADALVEDIRKRPYIDKALSEIFETIIDEQPTTFDVEKVVAELEEASTMDDIDDAFYIREYKAIDIVKRGGVA